MNELKTAAMTVRHGGMRNQVTRVNHTVGLALALVGLICTAGLVAGPISPASAQADNRSWSYTGSLNESHWHHTATLMPDGKVLVAGGAIGPELYDPSTGTWSYTGSLNEFRALHTATLLPEGKVLIAGGAGGASNNTAELYDPATGRWSFTGNLNVGRSSHTATLLQNGKVLIVGGTADGNLACNAAELYDPVTGTWSLTASLTELRLNHTATLLGNGKVLIVGGVYDFENYFNSTSAELYDPESESWSVTGSLNAGRVDHEALLLANGNVLVAGYAFSELYNAATGKWVKTDSLNQPRELHTATLLHNGKVLIAGGVQFGLGAPGHQPREAEIYNSATGSWKNTARLNEPRVNHTATLLFDGKVLVVGGGATRSAELYDPEILDPAPKIVLASVSGKKLVITGKNFHADAVILLNGVEQKTKNDAQNPQTRLIGKKAGKKIKAGDSIQVRNPDGTISSEFTFTGSQVGHTRVQFSSPATRLPS